eukprot:INCI9255.1.p1 GENE.INCI9255.1~~INCI9255.1.p1  ORF type:complete len:277 (+),score=42.35 INCI9255.1:77-907(+)
MISALRQASLRFGGVRRVRKLLVFPCGRGLCVQSGWFNSASRAAGMSTSVCSSNSSCHSTDRSILDHRTDFHCLDSFPSTIFSVPTAQDMRMLGEFFAEVALAGDVICLNGDLGVGKSCFAQGFIRHYFDDACMDVPSPTFLIDQCYDVDDFDDACGSDGSGDLAAAKTSVHHMDFYRFGDDLSDELLVANAEMLQLDRVFQESVSLLEWSERLPHVIAEHAERVLHLDFRTAWEGDEFDLEDVERLVTVRQPTPRRWQEKDNRLSIVFAKWKANR